MASVQPEAETKAGLVIHAQYDRDKPDVWKRASASFEQAYLRKHPPTDSMPVPLELSGWGVYRKDMVVSIAGDTSNENVGFSFLACARRFFGHGISITIMFSDHNDLSFVDRARELA